MNRKIRTLATVVLAGVLALPAIASTGLFPDVSADHQNATAIRWAARWPESGPLFRGFPDGSFRPDRELTETQFGAVVKRLFDAYDSWTRAETAKFLYQGHRGVTKAGNVPATTTATHHPPDGGAPHQWPYIQVETWSHGMLIIRVIFPDPAAAQAVENLRFAFSPPDITEQYDPYAKLTPIPPAEEPGVFEYQTILEAKFCNRAVSVFGEFPGQYGFTDEGQGYHRLVRCYPQALETAAVLLAESRERNGLPPKPIPVIPQPVGGPTETWFPGLDHPEHNDAIPINTFYDNYQRAADLTNDLTEACLTDNPASPILSDRLLQQLSNSIHWAQNLIPITERNKAEALRRHEEEATLYLEWLVYAWRSMEHDAESLIEHTESYRKCAEGRPLPPPEEPT